MKMEKEGKEGGRVEKWERRNELRVKVKGRGVR